MAAKKKPAPSLLYSNNFDPPLFLSGEIDHLVIDSVNHGRDTTLAWLGVLHELQPRERARLGPLIEKMRDHAIAMQELANLLDEEMEKLGDERRAAERTRCGEER